MDSYTQTTVLISCDISERELEMIFNTQITSAIHEYVYLSVAISARRPRVERPAALGAGFRHFRPRTLVLSYPTCC